MRAYLSVWRLPSAPVLLVAGFAGRLPSAMVPLALLLMVQERTGSYAVAGLASAALGIAMAVMAPILGRLADRRGPRGILLTQAAAYPLVLAVLLAAVLRTAPTAAIVAAAGAAGAATPLVSGTVRALWARVEPRYRTTAFALDGTATELVFVAGPTLVATLTVAADPAVGVVVAAVLAVFGSVGIATSRAVRGGRPTPSASRHRAGLFSTVLAPGMPRILVTGSALMLGIGALEVAIPAFAGSAGAPGMSGLLLAVWSLGSAAGGLWFGARLISASLPRQYRLGLLGVTIGLVPLALVESPLALGLLLFLGGTAIAPTLTVQNNLVSEIAPASAPTEAFTWLSTVAFGASAIGSAAGGALVDGQWGVSGSLVLAAASAGVGVLIALVPGRHRWRSARRRARRGHAGAPGAQHAAEPGRLAA